MSNFSQNGIQFTVDTESVMGGYPHHRVNSGILTNGKYDINKKTAAIQNNIESYVFAINAIDIDWNSAVLPNSDTSTGGSKTITNSSELLKLIDDMQKEIYVLTAAVIALANR